MNESGSGLWKRASERSVSLGPLKYLGALCYIPWGYLPHGDLQWHTLNWDMLVFLANQDFSDRGFSGLLLLLSLQSCRTLCHPIDGNPPGSAIPGILQPRTLEWVAVSFSNAWKWKVKVKSPSRVRLLATPWTSAHQASPSMGFSRPLLILWHLLGWKLNHSVVGWISRDNWSQ